MRWLPILCLLGLCATGCQKLDLAEEAQESTTVVEPLGHGEGTQLRPLSVTELMQSPALDSAVWIMGYAVGSTTRTLSNALFTVPTDYAHNILLSDDSLCTDASRCIAVELSSQRVRTSFSLSARPMMHGRALVVRGTPALYFGRNGLRNVTAGYWLPHFDLGNINVSPTPWDERDAEY